MTRYKFPMNKNLWPLKIAAKIVLARLPIPYKYWKRLGMFQHGQMNTGSYALKVFGVHRDKAFPNGLPANFTFLELGPGDSIASALVAKAHGAGRVVLVDAGNYADKTLETYRAIARDLAAAGLAVPDLEAARTFDDVLAACNADYMTGGLAALSSLPASSFDFIISHSVLEHIRKGDFDSTMRELSRLVAPSGRISHSIDFKDHLAYSLNNLRFPEKIWEADFFANSGFYTNRLRASQILQKMQAANGEIVHSDTGRWETLPLPRDKMLEPFRSMSDDDLLIRHMHVVLKAA